jgi:hypothetical protein
MESDPCVVNTTAAEYGPEFKNHCIEIYKLYVEMTDRISARRQSANSFFLSINTVLATSCAFLLGSLGNDRGPWITMVASLAGSVVCYSWYRLLRSYREHNSGRFKIIHELERLLPVRVYNAEWTVLGCCDDNKPYLHFSTVEARVPWVFLGLYLILFAVSVVAVVT